MKKEGRVEKELKKGYHHHMKKKKKKGGDDNTWSQKSPKGYIR